MLTKYGSNDEFMAAMMSLLQNGNQEAFMLMTFPTQTAIFQYLMTYGQKEGGILIIKQSVPMFQELSDADCVDTLPSPPKTRKKNKAPATQPIIPELPDADSVDNPPAPPKPRKTRTRKYAASQPIFRGLPDDDSSAPPETKKKMK